MNIFQRYYLDTLKYRFADFDGRASRSEYWYFALFNFLIFFTIAMLSVFLTFITPKLGFFGFGILSLASLALFIPSLALTVRRLHDTDKSGWLLLLGLIPLVGPIILLVFYLTPGTIGQNEYGPNPKELDAYEYEDGLELRPYEEEYDMEDYDDELNEDDFI